MGHGGRWALVAVGLVAALHGGALGAPAGAASASSASATPSTTTGGLPVPTGFRAAGHEALEPGVDHVLFHAADPQQAVHVARIDAALADRIRVVLSQDRVAGPYPRRERTSSMCLRLRCVVGVNGDFSDNVTHEPAGALLSAGELVRTPTFRHGYLSIDEAGTPRLGHDLPWRVALRLPDGHELPADGVNVARPADGVVLYTPRYGPSTATGHGGRELVVELAGPATSAGTPVRLVELRIPGDSRLEPGRLVLSGHGAGATAVEALWARWRQAGPAALALLAIDTAGVVEAIGGSPVLVRDRQWAFPDNADVFTRGAHPRTVVGWTAAGDLLAVTVDGRQPGYSHGMSLHSAATLLIELGAVEALNLDGGGSTTFVVHSRVRNRPSDAGGAERAVGSALVLLPRPGTVAVAEPRGTALACPVGGVPEDGFTDVPVANAHEAAVDCGAWWQVTRGAGGGVYRPAAPVSRAQLASLLAAMIVRSGGSLPAGAPDAFADDDGSPHEPSIDALAAAGILAGRHDGTFGPHDPVRRDQLATALARAVAHRRGAPLAAAPDHFADDDDSAHEPSIDGVAGAGLVGGVSLNLYGPREPVRRDQLATTVARALDLLVEEGLAATPA